MRKYNGQPIAENLWLWLIAYVQYNVSISVDKKIIIIIR